MNGNSASGARAGAPTVSKIMVILYAVSSLLYYFAAAVVPLIFGGTGGMYYIQLACGFLGALLVIAFLSVGVFVKKLPALYGAGLLVMSFGWVTTLFNLVGAYGGRSPLWQTVITVVVSMIVCANLLLPAIHYFLRGRGIGGIVKNVFTAIYLAASFLSYLYTAGVYVFLATRGVNPEYVVVQIGIATVSIFPAVFLAVATFAFTAKRD